jgi:hypothetical protein
MIIYDLFSGTGSSTQAFKDAGHTVISFEIDGNFVATEHVNIMNLKADELLAKYGRPDFIWASPPCTAFSVASMTKHWEKIEGLAYPKTPGALKGMDMVEHTLNLIKDLDPKYGWLLENPRGMLRILPMMQDYIRRTVTYCQYGDTRMKPTDLWGNVPGWTPKKPCNNGSTCHVASPRGTSSGTQALVNATERSRVPYDLGKEIMEALEVLNEVR